MPTRILLIPVLLAGCLDVPSPPPPLNAAQTGQAPAIAASTTLPSHFAMILKRDHGMWTYRACSLEITLFLNASRASFDCDAGEGGRVQAAREMTHDEVTGLRRLAQAADLYGGDHLGEDFTPGDGSFETLRVRPVRRRPCSGPRDLWQQELRGSRGAARVAAVTGSYRLGPVAEGRPRWCSLSAHHLTRQNQAINGSGRHQVELSDLSVSCPECAVAWVVANGADDRSTESRRRCLC